MSGSFEFEKFDRIPRLGWISKPSPVSSLDSLAAELGLAWLGVKQDDRLEALYGGSKARKLDYLLCEPHYEESRSWASLGSIGSGSLVALTSAAEKLGKRFEAHTFWVPVRAPEYENLAFIASGATELRYYGTAAELLVRQPGLFWGKSRGDAALIPPGATHGRATLGFVRAAFELKEQIAAKELPRPDRIYLAYGSGGTAVGLALGLRLADLETEVVAVRVVSRAFATNLRVRSIQNDALEVLSQADLASSAFHLHLRFDHSHAGAGYGIASVESMNARVRMERYGVALDDVYTGKAMAAIFSDARELAGKNVIFWNTRRGGTLPHEAGWRDRLPERLRHKLERFEASGPEARLEHRPVFTRRRFIAVGGAAALATALGVRTLGGYEAREGLSVLSSWESQVIEAAASIIVGVKLSKESAIEIARSIDSYVLALPEKTKSEIHAVFALIEHGTPISAGHLTRFSSLPVEARAHHLRALSEKKGLLGQAYGALRDLCMLGYYQRPSAWSELGYRGPWVSLQYDPAGSHRRSVPSYDRLMARPGHLPRAART